MTTHLAAWFESVAAPADAEINAVADDVLNQPSAERFTVPFEYNNVHWAAALSAEITRARLVTPSLEIRRTRPIIVPHNRAVLPSATLVKVYKPVKPIELIPSEELSVRYTASGLAQNHYALALLGKKDLGALPSGDIRRVRCTGTTTLVASQWTSVTLTPDEQLEAGLYELVNMMAFSVTAIACRVIIQGQPYRAGVMAFNGASEQVAFDGAHNWEAINKPYPMGRFPHNLLPKVQFLSNAADAAETVLLDLIKVG